eukprot:TRINITY_DN5092_c0_g1_i1.p1 TRINITY_DN5092_c0_g1~~TRINITY_DN5092_c0_g1_i1.p1  ORF type:complete len:690 (+),score=178.25 TRINITY_DN5092_c0_g1_i1:41-2071(+)
MATDDDIVVDWRDFLSDDDDDDDDIDLPASLDDGQNSVIVIDNLPVVTKAKYDKLVQIVHKLVAQYNPSKTFSGEFMMPLSNSGAEPQTQGFAFLEMESPEAAASAVEKLANYQLDKAHVFRVNHLRDFEKYAAIPETYHKPDMQPYKSRGNLNEWALDNRARDQFLLRAGDNTQVFWYDPKLSPVVAYEKKLWTESYAFWSPSGSYLGTFHRQGIALWGGENFERIWRLQHTGVSNIDFSPCENYLITTNRQQGEDCIIVWDLRTGRKLRSFPSTADVWPAFQWSHDDKFFARIREDASGISVYAAPGMNLLDNKSIKLQGVRDFAWSPSDNLLAYWIPEVNESPARVTLLRIPEKVEVAKKNLFNVNDCAIYWHPNGTYLSVKADRHTKTKKSSFTNFELFRVKEKNIPVDLLEFKEKVTAFAWEPCGTRFAVVHGDAPRPDISFYDMSLAKQSRLEPVVTLPKRATTSLFWSPKGHFCVLAGMQSGVLEFYNVDEQLTLGEGEHFMCTNVEWDPSGRYVATFVNHRRNPSESGYIIWSWTGQIREKAMLEKLSQFIWRPHPKSLLSPEQVADIEKNLKKYMAKYEPEDMALLTQQDDELLQTRERKRGEWKAFRDNVKEWLDRTRRKRREQRGYDSDDEDAFVVIQEVREEIIDEKEEVIAEAEALTEDDMRD